MMTLSPFKYLRVLAPLTAAAALSLGAMPAMAQSATGCSSFHFSLANPTPGSRVEIGTLLVSGIAQDVRATQGLGVSGIDFFLESREQGGTILGSVVPGTAPGPIGYGSFQATLTIPKMIGAHNFFAYAHSTVDNTDVIVSMPVAVGTDPSKVSLTPDAVATTTCRVGGTNVSSSSATTPAPSTSPAPIITTSPSTTAASASTIVLNVANPSPGNSIKVGKLVVQGDAVDRAATSGSGINRVDIFLDNPDNGGFMVGTATMGSGSSWQATISLPTNHTGLHNLYFIAHSSVSSATATVVVPVTVTQ